MPVDRRLTLWLHRAMKLSTYLSDNKIKAAEFARCVGASRSAVIRWKNGERFPNRKALVKIQSATKGKVKPDDFLKEAV